MNPDQLTFGFLQYVVFLLSTTCHESGHALVALRGGDFILPLNSCVGLDEELNPDPLTVDFHRSKPLMAVFGAGAHACPGASLARREVRIFLEEWLARIPDFRIAPGTTPRFVSGLTNAVRHLDLCWS